MTEHQPWDRNSPEYQAKLHQWENEPGFAPPPVPGMIPNRLGDIGPVLGVLLVIAALPFLIVASPIFLLLWLIDQGKKA